MYPDIAQLTSMAHSTMYRDCANASAAGEGAELHKSFRIFLRQSLQNLLALFKDFPGLLGPKMTVCATPDR